MTPPAVSVITPTFNQVHYLRRCVASVENQSFRDWEQIIVDDGSSDGTEDYASKIRDSRVNYIRQRHTGIENLHIIYNRALNESRAPLVAIVEGDDFWPSWKLGMQVPVMSNRDVLLSYGSAGLVTTGNAPYAVVGGHLRNRDVLMNNPIGTVLKRLLFTNFIPSVTLVIRREALDTIGGFKQPNGTRAVDSATCVSLSLDGKFAYIPRVLGYSQRHTLSVTHGINSSYQLAAKEGLSACVFGLQFLRENMQNGRLPVHLWYLEKELRHHVERILDLALLNNARLLLARQEWTKGGVAFSRLAKSQFPVFKVAGLLGMLAVAARFNFERFVGNVNAFPMQFE